MNKYPTKDEYAPVIVRLLDSVCFIVEMEVKMNQWSKMVDLMYGRAIKCGNYQLVGICCCLLKPELFLERFAFVLEECFTRNHYEQVVQIVWVYLFKYFPADAEKEKPILESIVRRSALMDISWATLIFYYISSKK